MLRAAAVAACAAAAAAQSSPDSATGKPLPPVPTFDPAVTDSPTPFGDAEKVVLNTTKNIPHHDDDDDDHLEFSADELNTKYDQYHNEPEVFGHHLALLEAKHTIKAEKRHTMRHIKHLYKERCHNISQDYKNLTEPLDDEISKKKDEAKEKAEKKYLPDFAKAKKDRDDADQATHDKYSPQKEQEKKALSDKLATEKQDYETKAAAVRQQAKDARASASDDVGVESRAALRAGAAPSPVPLASAALVFAAVVAGFAVTRARRTPAEVPIRAAASAEKEAELVGQYRTV